MSSKATSPTAQLLRSSRLFSLPPPLSRAGGTNPFGSGVSDSATEPYPTRQAIATPASSRARGDWGLKRQLPLRSTLKTSTPVFRINAIDTREHITDFESAADHALTVQKFQELRLPVTVQGRGHLRRHGNDRKLQAVNAFEETLDNTDPATTDAASTGAVFEDSSSTKRRWKHQGPWVPAMSEREFSAFLDSTLKHRSSEFLAFLRKDYEEQTALESENATKREARDFSEPSNAAASFEEYLRRLRADFSLTSKLARLLTQFLDLPPNGIGSSPSQHFTDIYLDKSARGPPASHPSAGLSYLRSDAHMYNHPLLGPQRRAPPVPARTLQPDGKILFGQVQNESGGLAGIAGFIAQAPGTRRTENARSRIGADPAGLLNGETGIAPREHDGSTVGVTIKGGSAIWVQANRASLDEAGTLHVDVTSADKTAIEVHTGAVMDDEPDGVRRREEVLPLDALPSLPSRAMSNQRMRPLDEGKSGRAGARSTGPSPRNLNTYGLSRDTSSSSAAADAFEEIRSSNRFGRKR